jgi:phosphatidylinositol alpha-1,6-mannosyltransferase
VEAVYFADGVAGSLAPFLRPFGPARFVVTVYGLEMTYKNPLARTLMHWGARACEKVVVISQNTRRITVESGVADEKIAVIYLGVEPTQLAADRLEALRSRFEGKHGLRFGHDRLLLNFGRQVRRKGVAEFIEKGMPLLEEDIKLLIGGQGPETGRIERLCRELGLEHRVLFLGPLPDEELAMLRASCDLFVMPNIRVSGDVEGFGQTQLECMHAGTPVIAFGVDALVESIREGGFLIEPGQYRAFAERIHWFYSLSPEERKALGEKCREYVRREYSWDKTTAQYLDLFKGRT